MRSRRDTKEYFCLYGLVDANIAKLISTNPDDIRNYYYEHPKASLRIVEGRIFETPAQAYPNNWKYYSKRHGIGYAIIHPACDKPMCGIDNLILERIEFGVNVLFSNFKDDMLPVKDTRKITDEQIKEIQHHALSRNIFACDWEHEDEFLAFSIIGHLWQEGSISGFFSNNFRESPFHKKELSYKEGETILTAIKDNIKTNMQLLLSAEGFDAKPVDWHGLVPPEDFNVLHNMFLSIRQSVRDLNTERLDARGAILNDFYIGMIKKQDIENPCQKKYPIIGKTESNLFLAISKTGGNNPRYRKDMHAFNSLDFTKPVGVFLSTKNYGGYNNCPIKYTVSFIQDNLDVISRLLLNYRLALDIYSQKRKEILRAIATKCGFPIKSPEVPGPIPQKAEVLLPKIAQDIIVSKEKSLRLTWGFQKALEEEQRLSNLSWKDRLELLKPDLSNEEYERLAQVP
jgi:hypothetical protein